MARRETSARAGGVARLFATLPSRWLGHVGALSVARLIAPVLRIAVPVWLSRVLGVEGLGDYQLVMSYYVIYAAAGSLGLWGLVVRDMAALRTRAGSLLLHACVLSITASLPMALVMGGTGMAYGGQTAIAMWVMAIALLPAGVALYSEGALLALNKAGYVAGFMLGEEAVLTALTCGVLWSGHGLIAVIATTVGVRVVFAAARFALTARLASGFVWRIETSICRDILRQAPVFFGATVLSALFWRLDLVMLSWLGTSTDVGLYAAALRIREHVSGSAGGDHGDDPAVWRHCTLSPRRVPHALCRGCEVPEPAGDRDELGDHGDGSHVHSVAVWQQVRCVGGHSCRC